IQTLAVFKLFGPKHDTVFSILSNESDETTDGSNKEIDKVKGLVVQLFPPGSTIVFYKRSHLHALRAQNGKIGLLQVPPERLHGKGIEPCEVTMKDGGCAIIDARLAFQIIEGNTIMIAFAVEEEVK
ncbi:hypothetical protein PMIN03_012576, partial [Paraphaeosphaeria minitans]